MWGLRTELSKQYPGSQAADLYNAVCHPHSLPAPWLHLKAQGHQEPTVRAFMEFHCLGFTRLWVATLTSSLDLSPLLCSLLSSISRTHMPARQVKMNELKVSVVLRHLRENALGPALTHLTLNSQCRKY